MYFLCSFNTLSLGAETTEWLNPFWLKVCISCLYHRIFWRLTIYVLNREKTTTWPNSTTPTPKFKFWHKKRKQYYIKFTCTKERVIYNRKKGTLFWFGNFSYLKVHFCTNLWTRALNELNCCIELIPLFLSLQIIRILLN